MENAGRGLTSKKLQQNPYEDGRQLQLLDTGCRFANQSNVEQGFVEMLYGLAQEVLIQFRLVGLAGTEIRGVGKYIHYESVSGAYSQGLELRTLPGRLCQLGKDLSKIWHLE
jgi:hypothetical protein